jgi:K(+)-stimulated pyrophosphate-energized sodium pump
MSTVLWAVIGCGVIAVLYGVVTASRVMAADCRHARMQEIAQAIQEGASAYLRRQYTTIAIVGVVVLSCCFLARQVRRRRLPDRRGAVGRHRLHRHERVGARQRAHRRGGAEEPGQGLDLAFKAGAVTGMLVAGLALLGVVGYYSCCSELGIAPAAARWSTRWSRSASAPR